MRKLPPPPSKQRLVWISNHAVARYKERIENVSTEEAVRRLRAIVEPHRGLTEGVYTIQSTKVGPPVDVKLMINGQFGVSTVYPVTNNQVVRAMKAGNWVPRTKDKS